MRGFEAVWQAVKDVSPGRDVAEAKDNLIKRMRAIGREHFENIDQSHRVGAPDERTAVKGPTAEEVLLEVEAAGEAPPEPPEAPKIADIPSIGTTTNAAPRYQIDM